MTEGNAREDEMQLEAALDALAVAAEGHDEIVAEIADAEADAVVEDALEIDSLEEALDAVTAIEDESDVAHEADVIGDEVDADPNVVAEKAFEDELRALDGKWYVIHSYAGFERKVKHNIEDRKSVV